MGRSLVCSLLQKRKCQENQGVPPPAAELGKEGAAMITTTRLFQWEVEGDTLILTPLIDLHDKERPHLEGAKTDVLTFLERTPTKNVVLDLGHTNYFWTAACRMFFKVGKEVRRRGGRMVLCNVANQLRRILRLAKLDGLWPICSSREEALEAARGEKR